MTSVIAMPESVNLLVELANPAARALLLAACAGAALAVFRVKTTTLRLFTWTTVLYAALALPLLGWMLPALPLPAPAFLRSETARRTAVVPIRSVVSLPLAGAEAAYTTELKSRSKESFVTTSSPLSPTQTSPSISWSAVAVTTYLVVALLLLARIVVGFVFARRLVRTAQKIEDLRVTQKLVVLADSHELSSVPEAAESEFISVPVTMGALRSTILLPAGWQEWDDTKLNAVIAHEVSHVARRDALTQSLSLLHRAIFWFSPLAWWLNRHLADLAEQASDEAALSYGADRADYARTLLGFFEALHATPGRVWWQGVSMAKAGQAEKRLERILAWRGTISMNLKKSIALAILALAMPAVYVAASARPVAGQTLEEVERGPMRAQQAPTAAAAPTAEVAERAALASQQAAPVIAARTAEQDAHAESSSSTYGNGDSYTYGFDDEQRFVIIRGDSDTYTMSGSQQDVRHAQKLKKQISGAFIWFQRDEKSYVVRDRATVDRALKLWAPQEELGKQQEVLGKQQEELGKQQEALGKKMEEIRVEVPDMTAQLDKLRAELKQLGSKATVDQLGDLQSEIGDLQSKIGDIQSHAGDQQGKLGEEMGALGEKQGKLGEQQGELGRKQGELAEQASREMKKILDEAITKGTAQPEL